MGFRDKAKRMKEDLVKTTQDSINRQEDSMEYGSIFIKEKIPEGISFWRPGFGDHLIDIIPFQSDGTDPRRSKGQWVYLVDVWVHKDVGHMYDQFVCQVRTHKIPDPMCEYLRVNRLPTDDWKKIAPKRRCAYLVWVHDTPEEEKKGIQIWEVAHWNFEKHLSEIAKNPKGGAPVPFSDTESGKSIAFKIAKSGTFTDASGKERDSMDFTGHRFVDRDSPVPDEWGDIIFPLDGCVKFKPTWEEQEKAFPFSNKVLLAPDSPEATPDKQTDDKPIENEKKKLVVGFECEHCGADVYDTSSGRVCEKGHGGIEGKEIKRTSALKAAGVETDEKEKTECPAGGTLGADIEKFATCNKCEIYDDCADAADKLKTAPKKEPPKTEAEPEKKTIIRRRRR